MKARPRGWGVDGGMKLYRGTVFEGSAGRRLRIGLSFRVRWVLDDEGEPCPEDLATGFIPDLDREVTVISIRETVAGHVGQSLGGLLLRFVKAFQDKTLIVPDQSVTVVGVEIIPLAVGSGGQGERVLREPLVS